MPPQLGGPPAGCDAAVALQYLDLLEDQLVARVGVALQAAGAQAAGRHVTVNEYLARRAAARLAEVVATGAETGAETDG